MTADIWSMQISGGSSSAASLGPGSYIRGNFPRTQLGTERAAIWAEADAWRTEHGGAASADDAAPNHTWDNITPADEELIYRMTGERIDHTGNHPQSLFAFMVARDRDRGMTNPLDADYLRGWLTQFDAADPDTHFQVEAVQRGLDYLKALTDKHSVETTAARHALGV